MSAPLLNLNPAEIPNSSVKFITGTHEIMPCTAGASTYTDMHMLQQAGQFSVPFESLHATLFQSNSRDGRIVEQTPSGTEYGWRTTEVRRPYSRTECRSSFREVRLPRKFNDLVAYKNQLAPS